MLKNLGPMALIVLLTACGAGSNNSNVVTPTESVSSTAVVRFHPTASTIEVLKTGPDPQSDNPDFAACNFSMDPIRGDLPYTLAADAKTLSLGNSSFSYKRPLKTPASLGGVPDGVFSVWTTPDVVKEGVTVVFELEVEPELLTFRLNCTG